MGFVDDNEAREYAVNMRGENLLISAAAGSGKTYTLVKRITEMLVNEPNRSIDRMLIVTFTKAAAQELKDRIASALTDAIASAGDDDLRKRLEKQKLLIGTACIGTIDSFFNDICKKYFVEAGVDPNYDIDDVKVDFIQNEVITDVLEKYYKKEHEDYKIVRELVDVTCGIAGDDDFKDKVIKNLLSYASNTVNPVKWLDEIVEKYDDPKFWYDYLKSETELLINDCIEHFKMLNDNVTGDLKEPEKYREKFLENIATLESMKRVLNEEDGYFKVELETLKFQAKPSATKKNDFFDEINAHELLKNENDLREDFKKEFKKLAGIDDKNPQTSDERKESFYSGIKAMKKYMRVLSDICKEIYNETLSRCTEENVYGFSQIAHFALKVLDNNDICNEFKEKFDEIYVDEYQDTNMMQEEIVTKVSRLPEEHNMFMVGDVKQAIYEFRRATPEFFMKKYHLFKENPNEGVLKMFNKNFRSRNEVLQGVNAIFNTVMTEKKSGIEYADNQALNFGAAQTYGELKFDEKTNKVITNDAYKCELIAGENEAAIIANRILKLFEDNFQVSGRKIKFSDICILSKKNNTLAELRKSLADYGFPVEPGSNDNLLLKHEVQDVINFLRVLDNPLQDIPLYAVLTSNFYNIKDNDIAKMRTEAGKVKNLYDIIKENEIASSFISDLNYFREKAISANVSDICREISMFKGYYNSLSENARENLRRIISLSASFDDGLKGGLYGFICYLDDVMLKDSKSNKATFTAASAGDNDNSLKFMTVHKSKGLEFPVVILAEAYWDNRGHQNSLFVDEKLGAGISFVDESGEKLSKSAPLIALKHKKTRTEREEIQRTLYVALTRAREKLIVLSEKGPEIQMNINASLPIIASDLAVKFAHDYYSLIKYGITSNGADNFWDFIPGGDENDETISERVQAERTASNAEEITEDNTVIYDDIAEYSYKKDEEKTDNMPELPRKMSVSALKRFGEEENAVKVHGKGIIDKIEIGADSDTKKVGGASFGTDVHNALRQIIDDRKNWPNDEKGISDYLKSFGTADTLPLLEIFMKSKRAAEIKTAEHVMTETPFTFKTSLEKYLNNNITDTKPVAIQGVIDLYYSKNQEICLVDFKTDRTDDPTNYELTESYKKQLMCYREALEKITGEKVSESVLWFIRSDTEIHI